MSNLSLDNISQLLNDDRFLLEFKACIAELTDDDMVSKNDPSRSSTEANSRSFLERKDSDNWSLDDVLQPTNQEPAHPKVIFSTEVSVFAYHNRDPVRPDLFKQRKESQVKFKQLVQQKVIQKHKAILASWHSLVQRAREDSRQNSEVELPAGVDNAQSNAGNTGVSGSGESSKPSYKERWRKVVEQKILTTKNKTEFPTFAQHMDSELMEVRRSANSSPRIEKTLATVQTEKTDSACPDLFIELTANRISVELMTSSSDVELGRSVEESRLSTDVNAELSQNKDVVSPAFLDSYTIIHFNDTSELPDEDNCLTNLTEDDSLKIRPFPDPSCSAEVKPDDLDTHVDSAERNGACRGDEEKLSAQRQNCVVYKVWLVYLLCLVHIGLSILFSAISGLGLLENTTASVSAMKLGNVSLQQPLNIWMGPSLNALSSKFFAFRPDCLVGFANYEVPKYEYSQDDTSTLSNLSFNQSVSCCDGPFKCNPVSENSFGDEASSICLDSSTYKIANLGNGSTSTEQCDYQGCFQDVCGDFSAPKPIVYLIYLCSVLIFPLGLIDSVLCSCFILVLGRVLEKHWSFFLILVSFISTLSISYLFTAFLVPNRVLIGWYPLCFSFSVIFLQNRAKVTGCCFKTRVRIFILVVLFATIAVLVVILPLTHIVTSLIASIVGFLIGGLLKIFDKDESNRFKLFSVLSVFLFSALAISVLMITLITKSSFFSEAAKSASSYHLDCLFFSDKFWCYMQ